MLQAFYLLACRSLTRPNRELGRWSNPSVYAGIGVVLALQALFVYAPFMQAVFGSAALGRASSRGPCAAAVVILPVAGAEERWRARRYATATAQSLAGTTTTLLHDGTSTPMTASARARASRAARAPSGVRPRPRRRA